MMVVWNFYEQHSYPDIAPPSMGGTSRLWPEFQVTQYFDLPSKIAAKKRWRYIGCFTVCTKVGTKEVPPVFFLRTCYFIYNETDVRHGNILHAVNIIFHKFSFTINTIFPTFAWDAIYRSCKTLWWSVVALHSGCFELVVVRKTASLECFLQGAKKM
jgi:hypothetical protein